ncbi:rhomboid family intramembrane serine protease [Solirubrobacter soli]|uniref:rhomboid family intramembrane serine protease n=1 Tax=Solirubrobacter soli TaxID=363832 RepID=UPI0004143E05|nr:rhomboid family intramembrane serine protease [Solirubrobacter soli]
MLPVRDNIPTNQVPYVTYALIAANIIVYFFWQRGGLSLGDPSNLHYQCQLAEWGAVPRDITHNAQPPLPADCGTDEASPYLTIFSAMFMHGGLLHLGGNMLFLWIFGNNVEDAMGPLKYLLFYVLSGVAALALQIVPDPNSTVVTLGASGAIAGVLGGYIRLFPRAKVITVIFIIFFFTILELPAMLVLGFWFVEQALFAANSIGSTGGGVAYFAHVGGFLFGFLTVRFFADPKRVDRQRERVAYS